VPPARCQPAKERVARSLLVEMEGLGIEFGGKGLDPLLLDPQPPGAEGLANGQVFEISNGHFGYLL